MLHTEKQTTDVLTAARHACTPVSLHLASNVEVGEGIINGARRWDVTDRDEEETSMKVESDALNQRSTECEAHRPVIVQRLEY